MRVTDGLGEVTSKIVDIFRGTEFAMCLSNQNFFHESSKVVIATYIVFINACVLMGFY